MKLKVCGLKNRENILQVLACKPDYIGFIFYDKSPRYVGGLDVDFVQSISSVKKVGVFVNETEIKILDYVSRFGLDYVQLHGDETAEFCESLQKNVRVIKAFQINKEFNFSVLNAYKDVCAYFIFDAKSEQYGGSGKVFDWKKLQEYKLDKPYFLSGGLSLENAGAAKDLNVYCLDVNSQFESSPGIKDINKLKQLVTVIASETNQSHNK